MSLESSEAVDFGKNGPNLDGSKGVIEAKFYLEKEPPKYEYHHYHPYPVPVPQPPPYPYWNTGGNWTYCSNSGQTRGSSCGGSINITGGTGGCASGSTNSGAGGEIKITSGVSGSADLGIPSVINCIAPDVFNIPPINFSCMSPTLQEGCTVEGGLTGQSFYKTSIDYENDYVTVRLVLKGYSPGCQVPGVMTEQAEYCTCCGAKRHKANDRFCAACGKKF